MVLNGNNAKDMEQRDLADGFGFDIASNANATVPGTGNNDDTDKFRKEPLRGY